MPVACANLLGDVGVRLDRPGHDQQQVGEVQLAGPALRLLVALVDLGNGGGRGRRLTTRCDRPRRVVGGRDEDGLGPLDLGGQVAQLGPVRPQPSPGRRAADQPQRVVDDSGHGAAEHPRGEVVELP